MINFYNYFLKDLCPSLQVPLQSPDANAATMQQ